MWELTAGIHYIIYIEHENIQLTGMISAVYPNAFYQSVKKRLGQGGLIDDYR